MWDPRFWLAVAPGQYPVVIEGLEGASSKRVEVNITGKIYIVAHAVVCF